MPKAVEHFNDLPYYDQDTGANIVYQFVVKPGDLGLLSAGRVRLKGPTAKTVDRHSGWDQLYIILKGTGAVIVGKKQFRVSAGYAVRIPANARHGVRLGAHENLEYVYVNAFRNSRELAKVMKGH